MPKVPLKKKKVDEPASWSRSFRQRDKDGSADSRDEKDEGLFVAQANPPQAKFPKKSKSTNADTDGLTKNKIGNGVIKLNTSYIELEKLVNSQNLEIELNIRDILGRRADARQSFSKTFYSTFESIVGEGYFASSKGGPHAHMIKAAAERTLSSAHNRLRASQTWASQGISDQTTRIQGDIQESWALRAQHTEKILEVGKLVGEDRMIMKLSEANLLDHDFEYSEASEALFAEDKENGTQGETWARTAKDQGRIVKRMTAAVAKY